MRLARAALITVTTALLFGTTGCRRFALHRHGSRVLKGAHVPRPLPPLSPSARTDALELPHFAAASVFVPTGTRFARPIVIAVHGDDESREAACEAWAAITNRDYFVLCPALGVSSGTNGAQSSCMSVECLADELREALVALRSRFGRYVAPKEVMLVGRSAGAARLVPIALQNPAVFSAVWLVDGGFREWSSAVSVAYAHRGGKFLGIACDIPSCESEAQRINTSARMAGLMTALVKPGAGESPWGPGIVEAIRLSWQSSKPQARPWATPVGPSFGPRPGKSEHFARPDG